MNNVLIYTDYFKGTIIPTFSFSETLKNQGYNVHYIGIADAMIEVKKAGFTTHTVFEKDFPLNSIHLAGNVNKNVLDLILKGELDELIKNLNPQLIVVTAHNPVEALVFYYKYKIKTAIFWAHFPVGYDFRNKKSYTDIIKDWCQAMMVESSNANGISIFIDYLFNQGYSITSFKDILNVFDQFDNLMAFSKEFLIEDAFKNTNEFYLGFCITSHNLFEGNVQELLSSLPHETISNKKIIYCSMGSWADGIDAKKTKQLFEKVIECMKTDNLNNYTLILVAGNLTEELETKEIPDNVIIRKWLPQLEILKHTSLAIIHGGMGSVKECIKEKNPMIVCPLGIDQFDNAKRIEHHQLGIEIDINNDSDEQILYKIMKILNSQTIKENLDKMHQYFENDSRNYEWIKIIGYEI